MPFVIGLTLFVIGAAVGLWCGLLAGSIFFNWESTDRSYKVSRTAILVLFGGGLVGGLPLFRYVLEADPQSVWFYLLGGGVGFILGVLAIWLRTRSTPTLPNVRFVVTLSDALRKQYPDREQRVQIIASGVVPLGVVASTTGRTEQELGTEFDEAIDHVEPPDDEEG